MDPPGFLKGPACSLQTLREAARNMETRVILYIASVVIFLFISFNLFFRVQCPFWLKLAGIIVLLIVSLKYEIYQFFGGAFFAPQLPRPVLLGLEALYGAFICLFFLLLLWDLYLLGNFLLEKAGIPIPKKLPIAWIKSGLCGVALALGIWGAWQAVKVPDIRRVDIKIAELPEALKGLKIVQLTDIHIGPILKKEWLTQVVQKVNRLDPDLILMTGDYVDGYAREIGEELMPLGDLKARYGVFAVGGNHEYYWDMPEWKKTLENIGLPFLENTHRAIAINGETVVVAGITDLAAVRFGFEEPDLKKAIEGAPAGIRILLSHQPKNGHSYGKEVDLMLSGHTHGGLMFFLQPLIARFNSGFVAGLYPGAGSNVYVSPGTGLWNGFSCRIGVPSEITLFTLLGSN